ncbi:hypothetical protein L2E82_14713 [Cichorium intybus]|uniref:Uncharacterized protein n=1 Tax=Cichorium intybus TaxID=13427 RepID=A0ACB9F0V4_CICIN|nr:hypothetical protein L2E82_14713 [Cichorium intybus]
MSPLPHRTKMDLVRSPEMASKAFIDTVNTCKKFQESDKAEMISAMAGGWNPRLIVEAWSEYVAAMKEHGLPVPELMVGEAKEVLERLPEVEFMVVDGRRKDLRELFGVAKLAVARSCCAKMLHGGAWLGSDGNWSLARRRVL